MYWGDDIKSFPQSPKSLSSLHSRCYCPGSGPSFALLKLSHTPGSWPQSHTVMKTLPSWICSAHMERSGLNAAVLSRLTSLLFCKHWDGASSFSPASNTSLPGKLLLIHQNPNTMPTSFIHSTYCGPSFGDPRAQLQLRGVAGKKGRGMEFEALGIKSISADL